MHQVGALQLPAPAPASDDDSLGDPGLDVLGAYFRQILETYLGDAWIAVAPEEPVVRVLAKDNPEERDFNENDLPLLCVWRQEVTGPNRSAESFEENVETLSILWVPAPTTQVKGARRSPFFNAFKSAISSAILHGRDQSYVHASDSALLSTDPLRHAAEAYGSDVMHLAGLDTWRLRRFQRVPVDVPTGGDTLSYPAYLATLEITESTNSDWTNAAWGTEPTVIRFDLTTGGVDPLTTNQAKVPAEPDPP